MPDAPSTGEPIGPDDLRTMLRVAGLAIADERVPAVLAEVNSQLVYARTLDPLLEGAPESAFVPFDPAWQIDEQNEVPR